MRDLLLPLGRVRSDQTRKVASVIFLASAWCLTSRVPLPSKGYPIAQESKQDLMDNHKVRRPL